MTLAALEAERDRAEAEFAEYLRGAFVQQVTQAVTLHFLASCAERQANRQEPA